MRPRVSAVVVRERSPMSRHRADLPRIAVLAAALACLAPAGARAASVTLLPAAGPAGTAATLRGAGLGAHRTLTITSGGATTRAVADAAGAFTAPLRVGAARGGWARITTRAGRTLVVDRFRVGAPVAAGESATPGGARLRWTSLGHGDVRLDAAGLPPRRAAAITIVGRRTRTLRTTRTGRLTATVAAPRGGVVRAGRVRLPFTALTGAPSTAAEPKPKPATAGAAPAPAGSTAPAGPGELSFPIRAAFYYPWFPQAWKQGGVSPYTHFTPSLGLYDSGDSATIARHLDELQYAHVQVGISSWWGQGHWTDQNLPKLLQTTRAVGSPVRWAVYYEQEGWGDPTVAQLTSDLAYLRDRYGSDPSYLRIGGRPVVFAYGDANDGCAMAQRWQQANAAIGAYVVLKVFPGYQTCPAQPDGWHQYAPAGREQSQAGRSFSISPGFWLATDAAPRLARDPACFRRAVRDMVASRAPWQLVTTFDEWGEGTAVQPAQEWATPSGYGAYLDALHDDGAGAAAASPC
jgi:hypothetical protein